MSDITRYRTETPRHRPGGADCTAKSGEYIDSGATELEYSVSEYQRIRVMEQWVKCE